MNCAQCKHFSTLQSICRKHAPKAQCVGLDQRNNSPLIVTMWPQVQKSDVCGEFEPDIKALN